MNRGDAEVSGRRGLARPRYWFPLLLSGGLAASSVPLSALGSRQLPTGIMLLARAAYPAVTQAMYGRGFPHGSFPFPLGWYWVGVLAVSVLLTTGRYRWTERRAGGRTALRGYLVTGLVLAGVAAALPLLA